MIVALIDNGSTFPAAHRQLRAVAAGLAERVGFKVEAVSWQHSDRVPATALDGVPAQMLVPWLRAHLACGEREFLFVPYFIGSRGAARTALSAALGQLRHEGHDFTFAFTEGLAVGGGLEDIVEAHIRETMSTHTLRTPAVIVVDHGGPSAESGRLRDAIAAELRARFGPTLRLLIAASMQGAAQAHNHPLLAEALAFPEFARGDVIIAPLFLAPGRHAAADGDLARIVHASQSRGPAEARRCFFTELIGSHPRVMEALAAALAAAVAARGVLAPKTTSPKANRNWCQILRQSATQARDEQQAG